MPVSKSDAPGADGPNTKTPPVAPPTASAEPAGPLAPAAESADPAAHRLLFERQVASDAGDEAALRRIADELAARGCR